MKQIVARNRGLTWFGAFNPDDMKEDRREEDERKDRERKDQEREKEVSLVDWSTPSAASPFRPASDLCARRVSSTAGFTPSAA